MDAVVLAGGPHDELAARTPGAPNKAFVEIRGATLVEQEQSQGDHAPHGD